MTASQEFQNKCTFLVTFQQTHICHNTIKKSSSSHFSALESITEENLTTTFGLESI